MEQVFIHVGLGIFWVGVAVWMGMTNGFDASACVIALVGCVFFYSAFKCLINPKRKKSDNLIQKLTKKK